MPPQEEPATIYEMNKVSDVKVKNDSSMRQNPGCCKKCTDTIILSLEGWFASLGRIVATHPVKVIIISIVVSLLCIIGVVEYYAENRQEKLWVASDSKSLEHSDWVAARYPPQSRIITVIGEFSNVLTPSGMKAVCEVDSKIRKIKNGTDSEWQKICLSLDKGGKICSPSTILTIWRNNCTLVESLDQSAILKSVNDADIGAVLLPTGAKINLNLLLGETSRSSSNNQITGAKYTKMTYFLKNQEVYQKSSGRRVDEKGQGWEEEFVKVFAKTTAGFTKIWTFSRVGQREESGSAISEDLKYLFVGYILIILYLSVMLGSFSRINQKIWLALLGVLTIGLAIGIAYGLSSAFQLFVTPVHNILPFLLLGIGVDDVFVIVQNWDNIGGPTNRDGKSVADNISRTMKSAGVSILVTSFTDVCAFLIGATTILPALRSFCIFAGIGVLAVFILTCTFYVALLALDGKRQRGSRDACCCCIKLSDDYEPSECSKRSYLQDFLKGPYSNVILSTPGRIVLLLLWALMMAVGAYGLSQLRQDFDPNWFLPAGSQTKEYNEVNDKYFSNEGIDAYAYVGQVDYFTQQNKLQEIYNNVDSNKFVVSGNTRSWYPIYIKWLNTSQYSGSLVNGKPASESDFYTFLDVFLNSTTMGAPFFNDIKRTEMTGGIKKITASRMKYKHIKLDGASVEVEAMDSVQETLQKTTFTEGFIVFGYTRFYVGWETNKVISKELIRNLVLAGVVVFLVTLFLIANLWVSLMVVSCVVFTLICISGYMHFWGLTVDTVTTIQLILAIGLSVDYSAHIGHAFMASREGNRVERAAHALEEIGPAVVHGGFSTFLAFVCLGASGSYVFSTFFKLFFLVVVFGMFHGLVYLPILLSLIGPKPYAASSDASNDNQSKSNVELEGTKANGNQEPNGVDNASFVQASLAS